MNIELNEKFNEDDENENVIKTNDTNNLYSILDNCMENGNIFVDIELNNYEKLIIH